LPRRVQISFQAFRQKKFEHQSKNTARLKDFMVEKSNKNLIFDKNPINDLILFGIYSVVINNEICSFERLIKECFILFPKAFGFARYPLWPDSRKLDRPLRSLRGKKLIKGDSKIEFFLTQEGREKAQEIGKSLRQGKLL